MGVECNSNGVAILHRAKDTLNRKLEVLAGKGIVVSFCYGRCDGHGIVWSVTAMNQSGEEFERPYLADTIERWVDIACAECINRGWMR